jgi:hypothetical protein
MKQTARRLTLPDHAERRRRLIADTMRDLRLASPPERAELIRAKVRHCRAVIAMYSEREADRTGYPALLAAIIDTHGEQP